MISQAVVFFNKRYKNYCKKCFGVIIEKDNMTTKKVAFA